MNESRCGILCSQCEYKDQFSCGGCTKIDHPFWGESCPLKDCCEKKELEHCGVCSEFPCALLTQFAYDKEQGDDGKRIEQCAKWAKEKAGELYMKYQSPLLAVADIEVSKHFYTELFEQKVIQDFGRNVTFHGGFSIQSDFGWLTGLPEDSILRKSNNMELYFEVNDFAAFMDRLNAFGPVELVTPPKKYEWQQNVVRFYDPDFHIIEVGESMETVIKRLLSEGNSVEETSKISMYPVEYVKMLQGQSEAE